MVKHINELPDNCLVTIFKHLPVKDLLKVAQVCRTWANIQRDVCKERHSLSIRGRSILNIDTEEEAISQLVLSDFLAFFDVPHYDLFEPYFHANVFEQGDQLKTSPFLVRKFPNIVRLSYYGSGISIKDLMHLLSKWPQLRELILIIPSNFNWSFVWKYINSLSSLKQLSLIVSSDAVINLPQVIPRLQQFDYACMDGIGKPLQDLVGQLNADQIQRIGIGSFQQHCTDINANQTRLKRMVKSYPWMAGKVTRFSNHLTTVSMPFLKYLCSTFSGMQFLNISFEDKVTFEQLFTQLSKLPHLVDLRLGSLCKNPMIEMTREPDNDPFRNITQENIREIPQLKSVRMLHIYDFECDNSKWHFLQYFFPNVKSVVIQDQANYCWHAYPFPRMQCESCPLQVIQALSRIESIYSLNIVSKGDFIFTK